MVPTGRTLSELLSCSDEWAVGKCGMLRPQQSWVPSEDQEQAGVCSKYLIINQETKTTRERHLGVGQTGWAAARAGPMAPSFGNK